MTTNRDIGRRLTEEVAARIRREPGDVDPDAHFVLDLGLSSLDLLALLAFAEKTFVVRFPDEELHELTTIGRVIAAIESRREPAKEVRR